ncbi:ankyrin repeat-containing domain protein [Lophiotrema nucula]|uniref:Ankyrin repeat-containing domain protein n=1 Tax=Lophiotrema nucula TaxID=690887 RepID=A0A6A5YM08_9PLEO|nr:ankyrin repeat-containing domain protein [Lophiotrema nucula]
MSSGLMSASHPPFLDYARIQNPQQPTLSLFLTACRDNDITTSLSQALDQEPGALTYGLNDAFRRSHLGLARQLLDNGAQYDTKTVLIASNSLDAIIMLVERGFNVNTALWHGGTVISMAVKNNNESVIRYLLRLGANPNLGPPRNAQGPVDQIRPIGNSGLALNEAAAKCTPEILGLLVQHGAVLSNSVALHRAAGVPPSIPPGERIPMLEYLVGLGLDVNAMDDAIKVADDDAGRGQWGSPLQYSIKWGRVEEARWLLDHGADPDLKTPWGGSPRDRVKRRFPPDHAFSILFQEY